MIMEANQNTIEVCDECGSEFYRRASKMANLCPQCSHFLYSYDNCDHHFENGRCVKCFWNGNISDYVEEKISEGSDSEDSLSRKMKNEVIKIASKRLGHSLSDDLIAKVRQKKWSYMGLEMVIDSVRTLDESEIENYLSKLE